MRVEGLNETSGFDERAGMSRALQGRGGGGAVERREFVRGRSQAGAPVPFTTARRFYVRLEAS